MLATAEETRRRDLRRPPAWPAADYHRPRGPADPPRRYRASLAATGSAAPRA
ncbi:hypothetical protein LT493_17870 [Streptomyces tricolor]|nr:hypothetical protein [Streptomyces tricolor]